MVMSHACTAYDRYSDGTQLIWMICSYCDIISNKTKVLPERADIKAYPGAFSEGNTCSKPSFYQRLCSREFAYASMHLSGRHMRGNQKCKHGGMTRHDLKLLKIHHIIIHTIHVWYVCLHTIHGWYVLWMVMV